MCADHSLSLFHWSRKYSLLTSSALQPSFHVPFVDLYHMHVDSFHLMYPPLAATFVGPPPVAKTRFSFLLIIQLYNLYDSPISPTDLWVKFLA